MNRGPCPTCGQPAAFTSSGEVHGRHRCRIPPVEPAPEGMAWCGVCGIAVTVLGDGRLNGHGRHGTACAGSWAAVGGSS